MSDEVREAHRRIWELLPGPATVVMAAVAALPASLRAEVVRSLVRAKPRWEEAGAIGSETRLRCQRIGLLEELLPALEAHEGGRARELQRYVGEQLARAGKGALRGSWLALRTLVRAGAIEAPDHVEYRKGPWALGGLGDLVAELRGDPDLLGEALWTLFTLEGDREFSFANVDKFARSGSTWLGALVELAGTGEVDRARLLREALAALQRDFPAYRAMWFARLYEALEPTAAERGAHLGQYVRLVASRIAQVQAFGVRALAAAAKAGAMLPFEQLDEIEPAWTARQKGVVVAALELAANMARADAAHVPRIAGAMARALGHPSGDVQLAAWQALQRLALPAATLRELIAPFAASLSPRVRKLAAPMPGAEPATVATPPRPAAATPPAAATVAPIASFDELIRELTALLGGADDPLVLERCLDGVLRFAGERPADFERRTAGLRKLARREVQQGFHAFVRAWLERRELGADEGCFEYRGRVDLMRPHQPRLCEVAAFARDGVALPLLALPTRAPFWVESETLLRRVGQWTAAGLTPGAQDLHQALRRVPAGERSAVRAALPTGLRAATAVAFATTAVFTPEVVVQWRQLRDGTRHRSQRVRLRVSEADAAHPLVLSTDLAEWWTPDELDSLLLLRALAGLAPNDTEPFAALAAHRIGGNVDGHTVARSDIAFLEPLLLPSTHFGANAYLLLAIALGARAPEMHGIAIDVVLAALADGRLRVDALGAALRQLFEVRFVTGARWARSLRTIADGGEAAAGSVFALLDVMFAGPADDAAREAGELLALGADLAAATGRRFATPDAVAFLRAVAASGGGKAAKLARELVSGTDVPPARSQR